MNNSASRAHVLDDGQPAVLVRLLGWLTLALMCAFFVNNILELGFGLTGPVHLVVYGIFALGTILGVVRSSHRTLRSEAALIS
ncbi:MAG: hypothetical protein ACO2ZF_00005, partial [Paracoccaceae bacterium]